MRAGGKCRFLLPFLLAAGTMPCAAAPPADDFEEAIRLDLDGKTRLAFSTYLRAATAGLPQAQFNVAVMLDSGRGVTRNITEAALWYARAAARGSPRAAYNMGLLYEAGEGVPQNTQLARAWYTASGRASSLPRSMDDRANNATDTAALTAPDPSFPSPGSRLMSEAGGVVLVWTSKPQPVPVRFYVELRLLDTSTSREVFSRIADTSSVFAVLPKQGGEYAWRVFAISSDGKDYRLSGWQSFTVELDDLGAR